MIYEQILKCLSPYFIGRYTLTCLRIGYMQEYPLVSVLILLEDTL